MLAQLPAVERVDRALVAIEDELDLLAAPARLAVRGCPRTLRIEPLTREAGAHSGRLVAGERTRTGAEPAAHARAGDAAAAGADIRGDERALRVRVGAYGAGEIARLIYIDIQILAQIRKLVLVLEESRFLRAAAGLLGTRRRHGLRLHDRARLLLDLRRRRRRLRLLRDHDAREALRDSLLVLRPLRR